MNLLNFTISALLFLNNLRIVEINFFKVEPVSLNIICSYGSDLNPELAGEYSKYLLLSWNGIADFANWNK